jgi:hypothetical protein
MCAHYLDVYAESEEYLVAANEIRTEAADLSFPPSFSESRARLPSPWLGGARGSAHVAAYWKAQELLFRNLKRVTRSSGFKKPFADAAFNENFFMWDAAFMAFHWRYACGAFDFQSGLDNLYAKQHKDGFICREIRESDGTDYFHRHDPASTGPNVLAWAELEYFGTSGDVVRLKRIFPALLAYHRWMKRNRTWPDGSYWSSGLACGMDNQPRTREGESVWIAHAHSAWIDATCQAALSARALVRIAEEIGQGARSDVNELRQEASALGIYIRDRLYDEARSTYADRRLGARDAGEPELSRTRTVGAYWALLVGGDAVPASRLDAFLEPLDNVAHFNRPTRVPSLAASDPHYQANGGYWLGGVWPSTTYMVLKGLTHVGAHDIAADIGANFAARVADCFSNTGTVWENMAPEGAARPGDPAKPDFCGWGGIGAVPVLLEYVYGLRPDAGRGVLNWDIRLRVAFGVARYPFGKSGLLHIECLERSTNSEIPRIFIRSTVALRLLITWGGEAETVGGFPVDRKARLATPRFSRIINVPRSMTEAEAARELSDDKLQKWQGGAQVILSESADVAMAGTAPVSLPLAAVPNVGGPTVDANMSSSLDQGVSTLVGMGFSEKDAKAALIAASGDIDDAIGRLVG